MSRDERPTSDALKRKFLAYLLRLRAGLAEWSEMWKTLLDDDWYIFEVDDRSGKLLAARYLPASWLEDMPGEVALIFARDFQASPDLHVDDGRVEETFECWMGTIIQSACEEAQRRAARKIGTVAGRHGTQQYASSNANVGELEPLEPVDRLAISKIDLHNAIADLPERSRTILLLYCNDHTIPEIAEKLGISYMTAYREFKKGIEYLRRRLGPDGFDDGP